MAMASDELESLTGIPWKLRGIQVHSRMSEEYLGIEPGMDAEMKMLALWMTEVLVIPTPVNAKVTRIHIALIGRGG